MIFKYLIILIIGLVNAQDLPSLEEITNPTKSISSSTTSSTTTSTSTTSSLNQEDIDNLLPEGFSFNLTQFVPGQFCKCDILEGACDVNCCCDEDCTDQDILAFSKCQDAHVQSYDPKFCFSTEIMVKNNTAYAVEQVNDNLFCIVNDNLNSQGFTYLDRAPILNVSDFEHMKSRHLAFNWHSTKDKTSTPIMTNESYYRSGDPILTITNLMEFSHLSLPQSMNGRQCNAYSPIKYLSQEERSCQVYLNPESDCTSIPELNAKNFLSGFKVIANQALLANLSKDDLIDIPELLVVPKPEVCINFNRQDRVCVDLVLNEALSEPTENCENILTELRLEIVHAGILGIQSIKALLELTNYSALRSQAKSPILINQKFSYVHYWTSENNTNVPELKSGNPGYLQGYPIRAGVLRLKDPQMVKDESTMATMTENDLFIDRGEDDFTKYLSIMTNSQDCNAVNRQRILFGINTRVGCIMSKTRKQLSESCMDIRKKAMDVLVGTYPNDAKTKKRNKRDQIPSFGMALLKRHRVGIFGNSLSTTPQDWIEVLIENLPDEDFFEALETNANGQCRDVITNLHIQIYFANVGAQANPQAKIIGIHYTFGSPEDINFQCVGLHCRLVNATQTIEISTSVSFVDMTQPALPQFKEKPVLEAKLPHDFFYPFVKSYSLSKASLPKMSIFMFVVVLKYFFLFQ